MPELLEISGLDDDLGQETPKVINSGPHTFSAPPANSIFVGLISLAISYAIGMIALRLSGRKEAGAFPSALGDLGVIRRCRPCDLTSKRPKSQQKWCLWTQAETRILGRHPTKERAARQERLIQMKKHRG